MQALNEVYDLDTKMAINTYIMRLKPDSHLETSLSLKRVSSLLELLFRAKQYIESEDLFLEKRYSSTEFYLDSWKGKKQHFEKNSYNEDENSIGLQRNTWKLNDDNKVFQTTTDSPTIAPPLLQRKSKFRCLSECLRGIITLNISQATLYDTKVSLVVVTSPSTNSKHLYNC